MHKIAACLLIALSALAQSNSNPLDLLLQKGSEEMSRGDLTTAEADFTSVLSESQSKQDQAHEVFADYHLFMLSELRRKPDAAEKWLLNGLDSCRKPGSRVTAISILPYLHSFYARHGMWTQDAATLQRIVDFYLADQSANVLQLAVYSRLQGDALMKIHDYPAAENAFRSAISFADQFATFRRGETAYDERELIAVLEKEGRKDQINDLKASRLSDVKTGIEPPQLLSKAPAIVPELARKANVTGQVILSAIVAETGELKDVAAVVPVGFGMDRNAIAAVHLWKFKAASKNGKPISAKITIAIELGGR